MLRLFSEEKNHKTRKFSCLFQVHKMRLLVIFGHFTDRNDSLPTLSYTSTNEIPHLSYTWNLKKVRLSDGASPYRAL